MGAIKACKDLPVSQSQGNWLFRGGYRGEAGCMEIKKMALCPHALLEEEDPWISRMFSAISAPPISSSSTFSCAHGTIKSQNSTFIKSSPHGREGKRCCCLRLRWFSRWAGTWVMSALMDFINIITSLPPPQAHLIWTAS